MRSRQQQLARAKATAASGVARRRAAVDAYAKLLPLIRRLRAGGLSFARIAARLNEPGHTTRDGRAWNPMLIWRVLDRAR
jgi:hypothetical protein